MWILSKGKHWKNRYFKYTAIISVTIHGKIYLPIVRYVISLF